MTTGIWYSIGCILYAKVLRALVVAAVDDPNETADDVFLAMLDALFKYTVRK